MDEKTIIEWLEDAMDLDEGTISNDTVLEELEEWDSLSRLSLMAIVKKKVNRMLTGNDLSSFVTVQDVIDFLR
ncbi:MAG: acyl carrier protein [Lachnospiraceae bacterium]|nr:acyl carrier protein [Lachnospiraceae bacterium]